MLFKAGEEAGFFKNGEVRLDHMGFGLVQGADGKKISTRKGGSFKLIDLLEEGQENAAKEMQERNKKNKEEDRMTEEYIKEASEKKEEKEEEKKEEEKEEEKKEEKKEGNEGSIIDSQKEENIEPEK